MAVFQTAADQRSNRHANSYYLCGSCCDVDPGKNFSARVARLPFDFQPKGSVSDRRMHFAVASLRGKLGGLHACGATFQYIVPLPNIFITRLFSKTALKRKDFQEILRLPWAQEVPSSNLGAPTKTSRMFSLVYRKHFSFRTQLWNSGRQACLIRKSFSFLEFARCQIWKNTRRQEC